VTNSRFKGYREAWKFRNILGDRDWAVEKTLDEFRNILGDRDWAVEKTLDGVSTDDLVVIDDIGKMWSVEIKAHKAMNPEKWRKQARENANKRELPWILAMKIHGTRSWLVHKVWTER
jgi:hypothetical protein